MITISLCMIVKNEEAVLDRCLSSIADLMDEIIIVDTGSTDKTKEIAAKYTSQIYDFDWQDDFSAARNFSFSKATKEYIYAPDADEYIDDSNHHKFSLLKKHLLPEIEIVQMEYLTPIEHNTVENFQNELRPKLFKRLREFCWIDPIHETVRLDPVVYDSDIQIHHLPQTSHGKRDFAIFEKHIYERNGISSRVALMYAKELYRCADASDLEKAYPFFSELVEHPDLSVEAHIIIGKYYLQTNQLETFYHSIIENTNLTCYSEICCEIGDYYQRTQDYDAASKWYLRAYEEASPYIHIESAGPLAYQGLIQCYHALQIPELVEHYQELLHNYQLPTS